MTGNIGILGGTFNPVHLGHLVLAQDAMEAFGLARVLLIPSASPPHKPGTGVVSSRQRLAMLRAAIAPFEGFEVSDIEIRRGGVSYSVDTLTELRRRNPRATFHFIIGADSLRELHSWRRIGDLLRLCEFVTMERPGSEVSSLSAAALKLPRADAARLKANVFAGHRVDISSSEIRRRVREGRAFQHLVPLAVARYIQRNRLYSKGA